VYWVLGNWKFVIANDLDNKLWENQEFDFEVSKAVERYIKRVFGENGLLKYNSDFVFHDVQTCLGKIEFATDTKTKTTTLSFI